jgi:hypothetical protein
MFEVVATVESSVETEILVALLSVCSVCTRGGGAKFRFIFPENSGLGDETDITVKGLAVVRKAARVYLEAYTSILLVDKDVLVRILTLRRRQS